MSILNVNRIQPVGSGQTVTINAANISAGSATVTAGTFSGNLSGNVNSTGVTTVTTLNATSIVGVATAGITTAYIGSVNDGPLSGARNRIINGDMRLDQRNAGASVTPTTLTFSVDRWGGAEQTDGSMTLQRSGIVPVGFTSSLVCTITSADSSLAATQYAIVRQGIEGYNIADLNWGTANAVPVTLSFWTRSSLTAPATYGGYLQNNAQDRSYPFTYTINSQNTWEYKTITIPGDTTGTWLTDNSTGVFVGFSMGTGSTYSGTAGSWGSALYLGATGATSLIGTNGATWYLTGVQLESGTVATPFERRSYGQELALCQRYYCKSSDPNVVATNGAVYTTSGMFLSGVANVYATTAAYSQTMNFPVTMRSTPSTVTFINTNLPTSPTSGYWSLYTNGAWLNALPGLQSATPTGFGVNMSGSGWTVTGSGSGLLYGAWTASAEL